MLFAKQADERAVIKPRQYQIDAFESVKTYLEYRDGSPCVVLPTGAGKTILIVLICQWVCSWGGRVLLLAHVKELLQQAADKLNAMAPDLHVGVYSAGLDRRETSMPVTIAGIQSVYQKASLLGRFDVVLIDECHLLPPDGDGMYRTFLADARANTPSLKLIGLTATPYRVTTGPLCGPNELLTAICHDVAVTDLIEQGYLSNLISKRAAMCNTNGLRVRGGEFLQEDVSLLMEATDAVRLACESIIERTWKRNSVLVFCSGVAHAEAVAEQLPNAELVTGETQDRNSILSRFQDRQFKFLVNVNVLTTGFDAPNVDCVVLLRPTLSPGLYYQMVGRGFRLNEGKSDCLVLDFGGNIERHGPINAIKPKPNKQGKATGKAITRVCPDCDEVVFSATRVCPGCGYEWPLIDEAKHGHQSSEADILGDDVDELPVFETRYRKHFKKGGSPDDPPTLRVEYVTKQGPVSSWMRNAVISEWVCIEHHGFAGNKAKLWWSARSNDPLPRTVDRAIDIAEGGGLAIAKRIWIAPDKANPKYNRIVKVELGEKPEAAELCGFCSGTGCDECRFDFSDVTPESVFGEADCPF